jgi:hypothetical protein
MRWREQTFVITDDFIEEHWSWRKQRIAWNNVVEIVGRNGCTTTVDLLMLSILDNRNIEITVDEANKDFSKIDKFLDSRFDTSPKDWRARLNMDVPGHPITLWSAPGYERSPGMTATAQDLSRYQKAVLMWAVAGGLIPFLLIPIMWTLRETLSPKLIVAVLAISSPGLALTGSMFKYAGWLEFAVAGICAAILNAAFYALFGALVCTAIRKLRALRTKS